MTCTVRRTCRDIGERDSRGPSESPCRPVEDWKDEAAYVLLGPPGSGKTTIFKHLAKRQGGRRVTARDFLTFDDRPEWHDTTLFIDGLDETRTGATDGRTPLDGIRAKLDRMGRPRFRLSCREADWFGANDRDHLKQVSPSGAVKVLRLDPLSAQDIRQFLNGVPRINDPEDFVAAAQEKGLHGLLANPQSLKMLAVAVGADSVWPETRTQAFDMACRALLAEHNEEHRIASPDRAGITDLIEASGRLCAVQLLTGAAGYALPGAESDQRFLELDRLQGTEREVLRCSLQSKLFESPTERRTGPVHRQVAEFLAARYLAALVENGLPVGRILALITGYDGVVVSELRGLSAWLAAHSKSSRAEVIPRDPLGIVLYGDARHFAPEEKRLLLDGIERQTAANPRLITTLQLDSRLGDLVSSDMENHVREILTAPTREDSWQSFIVILLEALRHGEPLPELAAPLKELIRDDTRWPRIRDRAVDVFVRHHRNDAEALTELKELAADVYADRVADSGDALLGCLLSTLYPAAISESEIVQYLRMPQRPNYSPEYEYFWSGQLPKRSTRTQLAVLLDQVVERYDKLLADERPHGLPAFFIRWLPTNLLARFLRLPGDEVDLTRLFHWLEPAAKAGDWTYDPDIGREESREIRRWLESHAAAWKTLLEMSLQHCGERPDCTESYRFYNCMREEEHRRLLGVARPRDFGLWCLDQAVAAKNRITAEWLIAEVAECLHYSRCDEGLSREAVSKRLIGFVGLNDAFDRRMVELEAPTSDRDASKPRAQARSRTEGPDWRDHVKPHADELRGNTARPQLLHELAKVYFGGYLNVQGNSPRDRLNALLAGDESLVDAVLSGFRKTIDRSDLPSDTKVIRLGIANRTHYLALPFMAGLEEMAKTAPSGEIHIDYRRLRLALAVHYTVPMWPTARHPADRPPPWFAWTLSNRPEVAANVLVRSVLSKLRRGAESPAGIHELAHSPDHAPIARLATMPLLRQFPVRCASGQLSSLNHLLLAARRYCDIDPLLALINEKRAEHRMSVAQRVHWLVAGLCIAPESYVGRLESYAAGKERRIRFLADAVTRQFGISPDLKCRRSAPALRLLIRLIGASCRPYSLGDESDEGVMVTPEMNAADRVRDCIEHLASISTQDASRALEALSSDDDLRPWRSLLMDATYRQEAARREAEFAYGDVAQVLETLAGGAPANVADLAALILEHLNEIARTIRDGNTSDWKQHWNVDHHNRPQNPRPEDACRDALLSDLRNRLMRLGIEVQPEGRYANDKRADIRVSFAHFNVPVEIKRSCHRDLWSAVRSQLIARYTVDPGTDGHGIYLVFWFGDTEDCRPTPPVMGSPVVTSLELEDRLLSTLSADERPRIGIRVIDVSIPSSD